MKLETGKPIMEGRYICYVEGLMGYAEPHIVTWCEGDWYFLQSTQRYPDKVLGWTGPLPVVTAKMLEPKPEYDL